MNKNSFTLTAGITFVFAGLLHLGRVAMGWDLVIEGLAIPAWLSVVAGIFLLSLAYQALVSYKK